jgi:hypothetical protein
MLLGDSAIVGYCGTLKSEEDERWRSHWNPRAEDPPPFCSKKKRSSYSSNPWRSEQYWSRHRQVRQDWWAGRLVHAHPRPTSMAHGGMGLNAIPEHQAQGSGRHYVLGCQLPWAQTQVGTLASLHLPSYLACSPVHPSNFSCMLPLEGQLCMHLACCRLWECMSMTRHSRIPAHVIAASFLRKRYLLAPTEVRFSLLVAAPGTHTFRFLVLFRPPLIGQRTHYSGRCVRGHPLVHAVRACAILHVHYRT